MDRLPARGLLTNGGMDAISINGGEQSNDPRFVQLAFRLSF